jgi:DNA replication and repair protein RecF
VILDHIKLINFRNYSELDLELPKEGALFLGKNGSGKTSLLEAFSLAILGKSPRGATSKDMIKFGEQESFVSASFHLEGEKSSHSIGFSRDKKRRVVKDGVVQSSLSSLYGDNRFLYLGPEDILLVVGVPDERRKFLNLILSQVDGEYLRTLIRYRTTLKQRNSLLTSSFDATLCDIYDRELAEATSLIVKRREEFFNTISERFTELYKSISSSESCVTVHYSPSIKCDTVALYEHSLRVRRGRDLEAGFTSIGPHRDNYRFLKDGKPLVTFGSQGECRSSAIVFKLATSQFLSVGEESVIWAIDDAFSDLDRGRRERFFEEIGDRGQLFVTVHSPKDAELYPLEKFEINSGVISRGI